jgi:hypothetical protein
MILNPTSMDGIWHSFLEASSVGGLDEGDDHCLQQLQVHPDCHLLDEFYEAPYPETKPTYEVIVMCLPLFVTDRCLNTIRIWAWGKWYYLVAQGRGKN